MGCAVQRRKVQIVGVNKTKPIIVVNQKKNYECILYHNIKKLISNNPILNLDISSLNSKLKFSLSSSTVMNNQIENFASSLGLSKVQESMFIDALKVSTEKFKVILPGNYLIESSAYIIYYFLSKKVKENLVEMRKFLFYIIETSRENDKFHTGKLSFLILNVFILITFGFLSFFVSYSVLETYDDFTFDKLETVFVHKSPCKNINPKLFSNYVLGKLKEINSNFSREKLLILMLSYTFSPLKKYFDLHSSHIMQVAIDNNDINKLIQRIEFFFDPENILDLFFTLKLKDF